MIVHQLFGTVATDRSELGKPEQVSPPNRAAAAAAAARALQVAILRAAVLSAVCGESFPVNALLITNFMARALRILPYTVPPVLTYQALSWPAGELL
jgi:hypothetical protein